MVININRNPTGFYFRTAAKGKIKLFLCTHLEGSVPKLDLRWNLHRRSKIWLPDLGRSGNSGVKAQRKRGKFWPEFFFVQKTEFFCSQKKESQTRWVRCRFQRKSSFGTDPKKPWKLEIFLFVKKSDWFCQNFALNLQFVKILLFFVLVWTFEIWIWRKKPEPFENRL